MSLKESEVWGKGVSNKIIVTLVTQGLLSSFLTCPAALILKLNLKYFFFVQILTQQMAKLQDTLNEANQVCAFIPMRSLLYYMYFSLLTEYYLLFDNYSIDSPFPEKFRYPEPWLAQFCFIIRIVSLHLS